jgi:uncharacterized protein (DUF1501 family)
MRSSVNRNRRRLLQQLAALPLAGGVSMLSGNTAHAACNNGKSLVCIFMAGGADSFNMFVPGSSEYDVYRATRGQLAVDGSDLINVNDSAQGAFGFNSLLPGFADLYNQNRLAVVANTGTLIRPTTKSDYLATNSIPESLFAHNTQQKLWQTGAGIVSGSASFGWGGAIGDHAANCNGNIPIAPTFSIAGNTDWLSSAKNNYISLNAGVAIERMYGYEGWSEWIPGDRIDEVGQTLENLIAQGQAARNSRMLNVVSDSVERATSATKSLHTAIRDNPLNQMEYNGANKLASQLHLVAKIIAAREELGMQQQIFFVQMGGWDTHSDQNIRLPLQYQELNEAVTAFQATIDDINKSDSVLSFTASDFGRTLTSNGNGTDHGWGGHNFVFGDSVEGGRIFGEMPNLASSGNDDDAGDDDGSFAGRIIPKISVNQYAATLARWTGVEESAISNALPDLANFAQKDLGFLRS